jgi:hypothetical protein
MEEFRLLKAQLSKDVTLVRLPPGWLKLSTRRKTNSGGANHDDDGNGAARGFGLAPPYFYGS